MNNRLRMRHIRCFLTIAEKGSVTAAASDLNSSQPAVSRSLNELEGIIGEKLFSRGGRELALTPAGVRLRRHFEAALFELDAGTRISAGKFDRPKVSVGMLPNVVRTLANNAAATFKDRERDVDLILHWSDVPGLIARLHNGKIDLLLGRLLGLEHMTGVSFEHLYAEPLIFVVNSDHPLSRDPERATLSNIDEELVIVPLGETIIRRELDKFLTARGIERFSRIIETVSFEFARSFLTARRAVACLPLGAVRQELADGRLVRLGIQGEELVSSVGISYATGRALSGYAQRFADDVRQEARNLI